MRIAFLCLVPIVFTSSYAFAAALPASPSFTVSTCAPIPAAIKLLHKLYNDVKPHTTSINDTASHMNRGDNFGPKHHLTEVINEQVEGIMGLTADATVHMLTLPRRQNCVDSPEADNDGESSLEGLASSAFQVFLEISGALNLALNLFQSQHDLHELFVSLGGSLTALLHSTNDMARRDITAMIRALEDETFWGFGEGLAGLELGRVKKEL